MIILPAIDILAGKPVRLSQGAYDSASVVADDALACAAQFEKDGAKWIHMVDLDGAKEGHPVNLELIGQTARSVSIPVECGGGFRTMEDIEAGLAAGLSRIILGTSALQDPDLLKEAVHRWPEQIAVGMDCRNGKVSVAGWLQDSEMDYLEFARRMEAMGVKTLIVTDIAKDGMMQGPSMEMYQTLRNAVSMDLIASGGVSSLDDIEALAASGMDGAISGKALYAGALDLKEAIAAGERLC